MNTLLSIKRISEINLINNNFHERKSTLKNIKIFLF